MPVRLQSCSKILIVVCLVLTVGLIEVGAQTKKKKRRHTSKPAAAKPAARTTSPRRRATTRRSAAASPPEIVIGQEPDEVIEVIQVEEA